MKRTLMVVAALASFAAAGAERTLYIKTKDAKVLEKPDLKAKLAGRLQPGDEVKWEGADKKETMLHKIRTPKVSGYTLQQNLTLHKPQAEALLKDDGKPIDPKAFASSGAATKALSEAALKYAEKKQTPDQLTKGMLTAEGVAQSVSTEAAQAYVMKQTGGAK